MAEVKSEGLLEERFPGYDFTIAKDATQPVWDLRGVGPEGSEDIQVQVKMGTEGYASDVSERMESALESHPNLYFMVSEDIFEKLHESHPELVQAYGPRLINLGLENREFTDNTKENIETLSGNMGLDVPDSLGGALPYVGEVVMGVRLIWNIVTTERGLASEEISDRARIHGIRALSLMSKFGVNQVFVWAGAGAGTAAMPGVGTVAAE